MSSSARSSAAALPPGVQPLHFHPPRSRLRHGVRPVAGRFNRLRWWVVGITQALFLGLCWPQWNGRPLVGFDLSRQQIHLFGGLFGPQDLLVLALLLIAGALALFLASAAGGRVFCGFACPQSVYTAVYLWLEQRVQGTPGQRQRREAQGARWAAGWRRGLTWLLWAALSLVLGWTLAAYFSSAPQLWLRTWAGQLGAGELTLMLGYAAFAMAQAGFLREKVCQHMCPYARFQGVMGSAVTQSVAYDAVRGEPRRAAARSGHGNVGSCVDCHLCVEVCPVGIDIRNGLQYECIGCGLCIDACDHVMAKARQPLGLIRFASLAGVDWCETWRQPRIRTYLGLLVITLAAAAATLGVRVPLQVEVVRDRGVMARTLRSGDVENVYRVHLQNFDTTAHRYTLSVEGVPGLRLEAPPAVEVEAGQERTVAVSVVWPGGLQAAAGQADASGDGPAAMAGRVRPLVFQVQAQADARVQRRRSSTFLLPG